MKGALERGLSGPEIQKHVMEMKEELAAAVTMEDFRSSLRKARKPMLLCTLADTPKHRKSRQNVPSCVGYTVRSTRYYFSIHLKANFHSADRVAFCRRGASRGKYCSGSCTNLKLVTVTSMSLTKFHTAIIYNPSELQEQLRIRRHDSKVIY